MLSEGDDLTEQLLDKLTTALGDPVDYRVTGPGGSLVTGHSDPPDLPDGTSDHGAAPVLFDSTSLGRPVRAVVLCAFISEAPFGGWAKVEVWQTVDERLALSRKLVTQSAMLLGSVLLTASLILWLGIQLDFKPLLDLREAIDQRSANDLRPIRRWGPLEPRPLVQPPNSLLDRLACAFALRDGFISDAANQMRNPVAALQSQAEAASAPTEAELRARVADLADSARATSRYACALPTMAREFRPR